MRTLILTLTILDPHAVSSNKLLLIKFIRGISELGLYEAKTFVEQVMFANGVPPTNSKIHVKVPTTGHAIQTLCDMNAPVTQNRVPGVKIDLYLKPQIWNLERYNPRVPPLIEGNEI